MATQQSRWNSAYRTTLIALLAGLAPACSVSDKPAGPPQGGKPAPVPVTIIEMPLGGSALPDRVFCIDS